MFRHDHLRVLGFAASFLAAVTTLAMLH